MKKPYATLRARPKQRLRRLHGSGSRDPLRWRGERPRRPGNTGVAGRPLGGHRLRRRRARALPPRAADRPRAAGRDRRSVLRQHRLRQHDSLRPGRALARQHRHRGAPARLHALERDGDGGQGESPASGRRRRPRRPHLEFRLAGDDVRHRLQPLLACRDGRPRRRPALYPGPFVAGRLRAGLPRRPSQRGAAPQLPPGGRRQGYLELSAPEADARVLAVPDRLDGPRPADGDLPGALPEVPPCARHRRHQQAQGLGLLRRRRDGRAGVARRHRPGGAREARQPDLRRQLQLATARRPGARQRQDHPGARERVPRLGLERHQAHLGQLLGSAARQGQGRDAAPRDDGHRRWRLPGHEGQRRRLRAQALLRAGPEAPRDGRQDERRGRLAPAARRPRPAEGLRCVPQGRTPRRPADGLAREDRQGFRHGQRAARARTPRTRPRS